jgi:hypothetical protein
MGESAWVAITTIIVTALNMIGSVALAYIRAKYGASSNVSAATSANVQPPNG